ncbi:MAG: YaaA family protein [Halanaerobium sp. MSAO_Bac5]|nr:MAG: YaaA family protein [Halanaerobium sp. MSAO_Bac5]
MKIILSPSKTQNHERKREEKGRAILKEDKTKELFEYLKSLSKEELKTELDIQGNLLDRTYQFYQEHSFDDQTLPAIECYNGAVFKQLDLESYAEKEFSYLEENLIILSPMYGPLHSDTEIWPYRLEMSLKPNNINLYEYWQEEMKAYFADVDLIINLASNEYSKVVEKNYQGKIIDFYFKEEKEDGSLKTIGYYVKQNRGKLLNKLIKNQVNSLDKIKEIELDGYKFNEKRSDQRKFMFIKPYTEQ